jgi:hypothetical protein
VPFATPCNGYSSLLSSYFWAGCYRCPGINSNSVFCAWNQGCNPPDCKARHQSCCTEHHPESPERLFQLTCYLQLVAGESRFNSHSLNASRRKRRRLPSNAGGFTTTRSDRTRRWQSPLHWPRSAVPLECSGASECLFHWVLQPLRGNR